MKEYEIVNFKFSIFDLKNKGFLKIKLPAAEQQDINWDGIQFIRHKWRSIGLIYPDTLRYRDSFNLEFLFR